jgi:hypothetical protein
MGEFILLPEKFAYHPTHNRKSFALLNIFHAVHYERWKHQHSAFNLRWIETILPVLQEELAALEIIVQER